MVLGVSMNKKLFKIIYLLLVTIFSVCTIFEIYNYLLFNSNLFGLVYLIFSVFLCFNMFIIIFNFNAANFKIRVSKNFMIAIIGLFSSFILYFLTSNLISYVDESGAFIDKIFLSIKVFKPIIYLILIVFSLMESNFNIVLRPRKNL